MQQATIFSPVDSYYSFRLGLLYLDAGHPQNSVAALKRAIELQPRERIYHAVLAEAYRLCGNSAEAEAHQARACDMDYFDAANLAVVRNQAQPTL
jgi:predicted Zn-dependent protease